MRRLAAALTCLAVASGCGVAQRATEAPPASQVVLDATAVDRAAQWSTEHGGDALLVMRDGELVGQAYSGTGSPATPHRLYSGTKTFALALVASLAHDRVLRLDDRASRWLPTWAADPAKRSITIRQLLGLVSGIDPSSGAIRSTGDLAKLDGATAKALAAPVVSPPGAQFGYGPAAFFVIGAAARTALAASPLGEADNGDVVGYLQRQVFAPIGIKPFRWDRDDAGQPDLAGGAYLTAPQWAQFGQLLNAGGRWNDQQILDPQVLAQAQTSGSAYPGYGLGAWLAEPGAIGDRRNGNAARIALSANYEFGNGTFRCANGTPPDLWFAAGYHGQRMYLVPSQNLVIVRFGDDRTFDDQGLLERLGLAIPAS